MSSNASRNEWLKPIVNELKDFDKKLARILAKASDDITAQMTELKRKTVSGRVRELQLAATRQAIRIILEDAFKEEEVIIKSYQERAVAIAEGISLKNAERIFKRMGFSSSDISMMRTMAIAAAIRGTDATIQRQLNRIPLSEQIWTTTETSMAQVNRILDSSLASGDSADDIAKKVKEFANPQTPGGVTYAAKRLGRTEIVNAYHAQAINDNIDKPWVDKVRWNLSKSHPTGDGCRCELYARKALFNPDNVPDKPHPQCLCFITPEVKPWRELEKDIMDGKFDKWAEDNFPEGNVSVPLTRTGGSTK